MDEMTSKTTGHSARATDREPALSDKVFITAVIIGAVFVIALWLGAFFVGFGAANAIGNCITTLGLLAALIDRRSQGNFFYNTGLVLVLIGVVVSNAPEIYSLIS